MAEYRGKKVIFSPHIHISGSAGATATANDILQGKTAYVDGVELTGTYVPLDTSDATATAEDIARGKTAYVDGEKITGTGSSGSAKYLTFYSDSAFTISISNGTKNWDGTLYYSTDLETWTTWDGTTTLASVDNVIYLCGLGNTYITGSAGDNGKFVMTGSGIHCDGDIMTLLDFGKVLVGQPISMATKAFQYLFQYCSALVTAPELTATTLSESCYQGMFAYSGLTSAPKLYATTLAKQCYYAMIANCADLETLPSLPVLTLASQCYGAMVSNCPKIKISETQTVEYPNAYRIPTTGTGTTASSALFNMFYNTGGSFTGTPVINTTYYTSNDIIS